MTKSQRECSNWKSPRCYDRKISFWDLVILYLYISLRYLTCWTAAQFRIFWEILALSPLTRAEIWPKTWFLAFFREAHNWSQKVITGHTWSHFENIVSPIAGHLWWFLVTPEHIWSLKSSSGHNSHCLVTNSQLVTFWHFCLSPMWGNFFLASSLSFLFINLVINGSNIVPSGHKWS